MINQIVLIYFLFINVLSYIIMWHDKQQAIKGRFRNSEKTLFTLALLLGALGIYMGMQKPLYHKKNKLKFRIGIPLCIGFNLGCVFLFHKYAG